MPKKKSKRDRDESKDDNKAKKKKSRSSKKEKKGGVNLDIQNAIKLATEKAKQVPVTVEPTVTIPIASGTNSKKPKFHTLILDDQGRAVDQYGSLLEASGPVRTLKANQSQVPVQKKNPYLAHLSSSFLTVKPNEGDQVKTKNRDFKKKKALQFVESGTYVRQGDRLRNKEAKKLMAGITSGRVGGGSGIALVGEVDDEEGVQKALRDDDSFVSFLPPYPGLEEVPVMEWWDLDFLPDSIQREKARSVVAMKEDHSSQLSLSNCTTHQLVHHPVPVRALGDDGLDVQPVKMMLTKRERKKLRRQRRKEKAQQKQDMVLMGLIPAPEPRFKLSTFMKTLGDQAVADPSKVEQKVMEQMKKRELEHLMRNQVELNC